MSTLKKTYVPTNFRDDSRRARAYEIFLDNLDQRAKIGNTLFRRRVLEQIEKELGVTRASSSSMYNVVKKFAVEHGECEDFGRTPGGPNVLKVVRAKDREVVAAGISIEQARELVRTASRKRKPKLEIV